MLALDFAGLVTKQSATTMARPFALLDMFSLLRQRVEPHRSALKCDDLTGRIANPHAQIQPDTSAQSPATFLQRDEMIDASTRIAGYRFAAKRLESPDHIDGRATLAALTAGKVAAFAERRLALLPIRTEDWLGCDYQSLIGTNTVFLLEFPGGPDSLDAWRKVALLIRAAGARVAVAGGRSQWEQVADHVDLLLIDYWDYAMRDFERIVTDLRREQPRLQLIAENVASWPERRYCVSLGVTYCMGSFTTCQDEEKQTDELSPSRLGVIEMLNLLRQDADLADIAKLVKRDPGVVMKLLAMANSTLSALSQPVTSIDQAIMVVGREQLYRWLSISFFLLGAGLPRDEILLELALRRGRFLELIAQDRASKTECDELFLIGLLSLVDSLLGLPMTKVVARLKLSDAMRKALLHGSGPLGLYLLLAVAVENGRADGVAHIAEKLALALSDIEMTSSTAATWAEDAVRLGR